MIPDMISFNFDPRHPFYFILFFFPFVFSVIVPHYIGFTCPRCLLWVQCKTGECPIFLASSQHRFGSLPEVP